ncbi:MAG: MBL fold metallo-hydrolase [Defluviitaleaceae bacterium]|nr:MBL fold metallo-hydrolase [Defluviitaleaceae bacterium]
MIINILASGSSGNAYLISDGQTQLLLDAGISLKYIQRGIDFGLSQIGGCLITHEHIDHAKAGESLMRRGVDIYTSAGTANAMGWSGHRLHAIHDRQDFKISTFAITAFTIEHDAAEALGFVIYSKATGDKLLYFTDTHYLRYRFNGLTHILGECNYCPKILAANVQSGAVSPIVAKRTAKNHMSIDTFCEMLEAYDISHLRQIYLLHLSENNSDALAFKERIQRISGVEAYVC